MKPNPQKIGLAFSAAGHSLLGIGGISAINGTLNKLVEGSVIAGFFFSVIGTFLSTLYTDSEPAPDTSITTVKTETEKVETTKTP